MVESLEVVPHAEGCLATIWEGGTKALRHLKLNTAYSNAVYLTALNFSAGSILAIELIKHSGIIKVSRHSGMRVPGLQGDGRGRIMIEPTRYPNPYTLTEAVPDLPFSPR